MRFETERIRLRKMTVEDAAIYHKWRNDPDVMKTTAPLLDVYRMEETEEFVQQVILGSPSSKCYLMIEKQSEKPIGVISLIHIDYKNRNAECILDIGKKRHGGKDMGQRR